MLSTGMIDPTMLESQYKQAEGTSFFGKISKMLGGGSEGPVLGYSDE